VIVRFRPKFSAERFREARRVVEARRPKAAAGKGEGASDVAEFFTALHAAEAASPSPSTGRHRRLLLLGGGGGDDDDDDDDDDALSYRPSLRAAAPAFRVAVLDGASAADRDAFLREYEDDIESFETDVEMRAFDVDVDFDSDANANANAPGPVMRAACPYSQTSLTDAQWNLDRATYEQMQMPNAASISPATISRLDGAYDPPDCLCGRGVHVYSLDTGVRVTHEDFTPHGRVESGWNFVGCDGKVFDASGHGTHVAATAVGATSGIAKCASLTPVQILDGEGRGSSSDVLSALDWVLEREIPPGHRKVVSMSVGGPRSEAVNAAVRDLTSLGVVVVAAGGNEREDARGVSPASEPAALTVGSTACRVAKTDGARCAGDAMSPFSNYGPVVDVFAPGSDVRSAWKTSDASYRVVSGTSMAAPLVAGAAALYLEKYPTASVEDVARAATQTATALNGVEGEGSGGGGGGGRVLNLPAMLARAPPSGGGGGGG
jgi:subtilisin family serine protease